MIESFYRSPQSTIYCGDNQAVMAEMPELSVDMIMTSPPYFGLRLYKAPVKIFDNQNGCEHEWIDAGIKPAHPDRSTGDQDSNGSGIFVDRIKRGSQPSKTARGEAIQLGHFCVKCSAWRGQLGCEPEPDLFIKHLCDTFDACKRVLKKTGVLWVNLKDSYAGSGSPGGDFRDGKGGDEYLRPYNRNTVAAKSLIGIPERFVLEMLNRGWIRRNTIIWHKPNVMPSSARDRFTEDFEYLYMFTQSQRYYFEQQFENQTGNAHSRGTEDKNLEYQKERGSFINWKSPAVHLPLGRNKRTVWKICTQGSSVQGSSIKHFATFPLALCTTPILATVPEQICSKCGQPRKRIYEATGEYDVQKWGHGSVTVDVQGASETSALRTGLVKIKALVGLSDCGCGAAWEPGVVMDPFGGSGTVAIAAYRLKRKAILIDISEEYCKLAVKRLLTEK